MAPADEPAPGAAAPLLDRRSRLRNLALVAHVTASVGWLGAVAAFLALALAGLNSQDAQVVRGSYVAMDLTTRFVILPLAFAALLTGLVSSLGTHWGLLRHYWVLVKFLLTVFAVIILVGQLEPIGMLAKEAAAGRLAGDDLRGTRVSMVIHAAGGLLVLLTNAVLGIYKPRGLTPHGARAAKGALSGP